MKIRKAKKSDAKRITEIFQNEYAKPPFSEVWSDKLAKEKINSYFKYQTIFVLEIDKKIQGFIILSTFLKNKGLSGFINELAVSSEFRGKGYGKALMDQAEDYFRKIKAKEIELSTIPKSIAYIMYQKLNYQNEKLVLMKKELN